MNEAEFALYSITKSFPTLYNSVSIPSSAQVAHKFRQVVKTTAFEIHDDRERKLCTKIGRKFLYTNIKFRVDISR